MAGRIQSHELIEEIRAIARQYYDQGWDVIVEATSDEELRAAIGRATRFQTALGNVERKIVAPYREQRANAGISEAEHELEIGARDALRDAEQGDVYQGLVAEPVEVFGVSGLVDADADVLHNPLGHHLPGLALDGPVCGACTAEHRRRFGTRHDRQQLRHVSVAAIRLCAQRRAEVDEDEREVNAEYQAELAYERYLENGGRHAAAIQADLEEERYREQGFEGPYGEDLRG